METAAFVDTISLTRAEKLHPLLRSEVKEVLHSLWETGVKVRITQGLRTYAEQRALYAIGRTSPGRIVTNAREGHSLHNFGLAIDFCILRDNGTASFNTKEDVNGDGKADWMQVVEAFKAKGYEWGGDWHSFKDTPHVQKDFGKTTAQLRALTATGEIYPKLA